MLSTQHLEKSTYRPVRWGLHSSLYLTQASTHPAGWHLLWLVLKPSPPTTSEACTSHPARCGLLLVWTLLHPLPTGLKPAAYWLEYCSTYCLLVWTCGLDIASPTFDWFEGWSTYCLQFWRLLHLLPTILKVAPPAAYCCSTSCLCLLVWMLLHPLPTIILKVAWPRATKFFCALTSSMFRPQPKPSPSTLTPPPTCCTLAASMCCLFPISITHTLHLFNLFRGVDNVEQQRWHFSFGSDLGPFLDCTFLCIDEYFFLNIFPQHRKNMPVSKSHQFHLEFD